MAYIYKIQNKINNKIYIGKTELNDPLKRFNEHIKASKRNSINNRPLYKAINKYGINNFSFEVIEETDTPNEREIYYIDKYKSYGKSGYNATLGGDGKKYIKHKDEDIISYYNEHRSMKETSNYFSVSVDYLRLVIDRNNIQRVNREEISSKQKIKIIQLDKQTNEILNIFNSISEAACSIGDISKKTHIVANCKNKRKSAYGYKWQYLI